MWTKMLAAAALFAAANVGAQAPSHDVSEQLRAVLPEDVAEQVIQRVESARSRGLPAQAIEARALELVAKGGSAEMVLDRVSQFAGELGEAREALRRGGIERPSGDEIEAAADVISKGVDGADVSALAKSAPSGRSLVVPLTVVSSLLAADHPANKALAEVKARLDAGSSDSEIKGMASAASGRKPAVTGRELAETKRPANAGRPAGVPANPGAGAIPPVTPPVNAPPVGRP